MDWSNDDTGHEQVVGTEVADPHPSGVDNTQSQGSNMILLGGKSLLTDLTMEKNSLDASFVHSHRLLDNGRFACNLEVFPISAHHILYRNSKSEAWQ